ncbi:MAG: DUF4403 family protein [Xanthobacteraceae bacterium]|nr:DUF4403 family protein [Xanthobacteraceae bacterium]
MRLTSVAIAAGVVAAAFAVGLTAMDWLASDSASAPPPPMLAPPPPLPETTRHSVLLTPIQIPLKAIVDAAERAAPRDFAGKAANPVPQLLQDADISWTAARGAITASGGGNGLTMAAPLAGKLRVTGALSAGAKGALGEALGSLLGGNVAKQIGTINIKAFKADAEIRGTVAMTSRPALTANWRIEPNLAARVDLGDTQLSIAGARVSVPAQTKSAIDRAVNEQLAALQQRIRDDPLLEQSARREWARLCRSIPLHDAAATPSPLWLELKPVRAIAVQPAIDAGNVTLLLGLDAETRITARETKPQCPFPATLELISPRPGRVDIAVPMDLPFTDIDKILAAQLAGKTFPEGKDEAVAVTVKRATVAAAGDRLLISLVVDAKEKRSWFGLGADATVRIWGKPILDPARQTVRLTDIELAVESETAHGLFGAATRAAIPYLEQAVAEKAVIDLKAFATDARQRIGAMIAGLRKTEQGIRVEAAIDSLRLAGIAFDSTKLRIVAEAGGPVQVTVTRLPAF